MLSKNTFSIESLESFVGYYDPERDWNGWDCPYFEWDEAVRIAEWSNRWNGEEQLKVDAEKRLIICKEDPDEPFDIDGVEKITVDGEKMLYSIGTGWWIWEASDKWQEESDFESDQ